MSSVLSDDLALRELLEVLLGQEGRRRLSLRHKNNNELFTLYDNELVLRVHNTRNLGNDRGLLARFKGYLNGYPPSPELAKAFHARQETIISLILVGAMKNFGLASGILLTLFSEKAAIPSSIMVVFFLSRTLWLGFHFNKPT